MGSGESIRNARDALRGVRRAHLNARLTPHSIRRRSAVTQSAKNNGLAPRLKRYTVVIERRFFVLSPGQIHAYIAAYVGFTIFKKLS